jgi:excinuclease ABC subunit B
MGKVSEPAPSKLTTIATDPVLEHMSKAQLEKAIATTKRRMLEASKNLDFLQAAQYRDEMLRLEDMLQHSQK